MTVAYTAPAPSRRRTRHDSARGRGRTPALLILDDADDAGGEVLDRAAALIGASVGGGCWSSCCTAARATPGVRSSAGTVARAGSARRTRPWPRSRASTCPRGRAAPGRGARRGERRRPACRASRRGGVGAGAGVARDRGERRPRRRERGELRSAEAELSDDLLALRALDERGGATAARRTRRRCRRCAPSSGSPRSTRPTRSTSSVASGWWPSWLPGSWARRCLPSSDPSGSGKSSAVRAGLLPALASGVLPGSERWRQALMRPGEHPVADARAGAAGERRAGGARGRPVRGGCSRSAVTSDERTAFLDALVELARGPRPERPGGGRDARRLLRTLRGVRRARAARRREPGARRPDAARRAAPGHRRAGAPGRACGSSRR